MLNNITYSLSFKYNLLGAEHTYSVEEVASSSSKAEAQAMRRPIVSAYGMRLVGMVVIGG